MVEWDGEDRLAMGCEFSSASDTAEEEQQPKFNATQRQIQVKHNTNTNETSIQMQKHDMLVFICNREGKRTQVLERGGVNITGGDE